jgi:hypothetical protein
LAEALTRRPPIRSSHGCAGLEPRGEMLGMRAVETDGHLPTGESLEEAIVIM